MEFSVLTGIKSSLLPVVGCSFLKMKNELKIIDLFAGIGGIRLGFEKIGAKCVFSSEWDKHAQDMYEENFGERPFGDINQIAPEEVPDHDFLLAGFPCQPFSIAGKQLGFADTRGTLFFNIEKILEAKQPYGFLLENVKRLTTHDNGRTFKVIIEKLEALGYTVYHKVLNSLDYGIPQKRERIYIVGFKDPIHFKFPKPLGYYKPLSEFLEDDKEVPDNYFVSDEIKENGFQKLNQTHHIQVFGTRILVVTFQLYHILAHYEQVVVTTISLVNTRRLTGRKC